MGNPAIDIQGWGQSCTLRKTWRSNGTCILHLAREFEESRVEAEKLLNRVEDQKSPLEGALEEAPPNRYLRRYAAHGNTTACGRVSLKANF